MIRLAHLAIRRPRAVLLCAVIVAGALTLIGLGVSSSLSPSVTTVPGTQSSHAQDLAESEFGPSVLVPILLEGPRHELDRQGPALVRELGQRDDTRVLSAWGTGDTAAELRPTARAAMIVASVAQTEEAMVKTHQQQIDTLVERITKAPVSASVSGQPSIDKAMQDQSIDTTRRTVAITLPILFVVLLLLLRAPVAALGITALAAGTAYSGLGLTALSGKVMDVDAISVLLGTMTGLVLGAGYGLIFFRRWRGAYRESGTAHDAAYAASTTVKSTGRALLIAGTAMILANLVTDALGPTEVLSSLFIDATLCAILAVGAAVVVMPAALTLLGGRALAGSFAAPAFLVRQWDRLVGGGGLVLRGAVVLGAMATALLAVLALPLTTLDTGPPSAKYLPEDDAARQSFERISQVMGPGWPTPYNIVVVSQTRPITDPKLLDRLDSFQDRLAKDPRVVSVVGPGSLAATSEELSILPTSLEDSSKLLKSGKKDLGRLEQGLGEAGAGVDQLRSGLAGAAEGAGQIESGSGSAEAGAAALRNGLEQARSGAAQISGGLDQALSGARRLRDGSATALTGSQQITGGLGEAVKPVQAGVPIVKQMAGDVGASSAAVKDASGDAQALAAQLDQATAALQALPESAGKTAAIGALASARQAAGGLESSLAGTSQTLSGASGVATAFSGQVEQLSAGLTQLFAGSTQLTSGISQLKTGNADLAAGIDKLSSGGGELTTGVTALRDGAAQLENGLGQLTGGAGQLASGLSAGSGPTAVLREGLGEAETKVGAFRQDLPSPEDLERLQRQSPGLFDSGYFVLAAVAGASEEQQTQASFAVNLESGGNAGQISVISRYAADDERTRQLGEDLSTWTAQFAESTGTEAALGGPAGALNDFRTAAAEDIWPVVLGVSIAVLLLLMAFLRAIVLPIVAVAFNLLSAAAAFGIMTVLFSGDDPVLGGPGYIDPMSIIAAFTAIFGMTLIFEVQLLWRTREAFLATGDPHGALRTGLDRTAAASTGAAIAMVAAIVPFILTDLVVARQLGVGVALVILLDAIIVRPVLLPAAVEVLGRWSWWPTSRHAPHPPASTPTPAAGPRVVPGPGPAAVGSGS